MLAQTIRRRILLTGESGLLSTMGPVGRAVLGGAAGDAGGEAPAAPAGPGLLFSCSADRS